MKEFFVSYDIAFALKKQGFNEPCFALFYLDEFELKSSMFTNTEFIVEGESLFVTAPLYDNVIDWFKDKQHINIETPMNENGFYSIDMKTSRNDKLEVIDKWQDIHLHFKYYGFKTKRDALNKAFKEALKLI